MKRLTPLLLSLALVAHAEEPAGRSPVEPKTLPAPEQTVEPVKPAIEHLDDGRLKIGEVVFDPKTREIRFPAEVNMTEGLLEFLIVHRDGKIHESLLSTGISPTNLNVAFKLLHYKPSPELYRNLEPDGTIAPGFQPATEEQKNRSRIRILVETKDGKAVPASSWISHARTEKPMPEQAWVYGGSFVHDGRFAAESSGDIVAIFVSNTTMVNYPGVDNDDDEVWLPHATRVPEIGTPVTVVIQPAPKP